MSSEPTPEEALAILKKMREKQRERVREYKKTDKGKEVNNKSSLNYYYAHKDEISLKNKEKRALEKENNKSNNPLTTF